MSSNRHNKAPNNAPSLLKVLLFEIFVSHWLVTILAVLLILSGMLLAQVSHDSRRSMSQWQSLRNQQQAQQVEFESLRLELSSLSEANRINHLAKTELGMVEVNSTNEKVIAL